MTFRTYIPGFPSKSPPQVLILFCWIPFWFVSLKYWGAPFLPSARVPTRWSDAVPWHTVLHLRSLDAICSLSLNSRFMQPTAYSASPPNGRVDTTRVPSPELNSWFPAPPHLLPDGSCSQILVLSLTLFSHFSYPVCQQPVSSWNAFWILPGGPTSAFTGLVQTIVLSAEPLQWPPNGSPCFSVCSIVCSPQSNQSDLLKSKFWSSHSLRGLGGREVKSLRKYSVVSHHT